jgi:hypothetical protein
LQKRIAQFDSGRLRNSISHSTHSNTEALNYTWEKSKSGKPSGKGKTVPNGIPDESESG